MAVIDMTLLVPPLSGIASQLAEVSSIVKDPA